MSRLYPKMVIFVPNDSDEEDEERSRVAGLSKDELWQEHYDYFLWCTKESKSLHQCVYHATVLATLDDSAEHKQLCLDLIRAHYDRETD